MEKAQMKPPNVVLLSLLSSDTSNFVDLKMLCYSLSASTYETVHCLVKKKVKVTLQSNIYMPKCWVSTQGSILNFFLFAFRWKSRQVHPIRLLARVRTFSLKVTVHRLEFWCNKNFPNAALNLEQLLSARLRYVIVLSR